MNKTILSIMAFAIISNIHAVTIKSVGYGNIQEEATNNALVNLSSQISSQVSSEFNTLTKLIDKDYKKSKQKIVKVKSELPILGAKFYYKRNANLVEVTLDSKYSLDAYENVLGKLHFEISKIEQLISSTQSSTKQYELYSQLKYYISEFNKHKIVATILESNNIPPLDISEASITAKIINLSKELDSIDLATKLLSKSFQNHKVFIYPAKNGISSEVTPFARVFKDNLSKYLNTSPSPKDAELFLSGNYEILKDKIFITYNLIDKQNKSYKQESITLSKKAYEGLRIKPRTITFDEEIHSNALKSSELKIDISFKNQGKKGLLLYQNESVDLVVRSNKPIYFYLIGHILHENDTKSYLVELQPDAHGKEKFSYRLGGSDVNIPVSLGEFEISEPFGFESVQMFASTKPLTNFIPNCSLDNDGLCIVGNKPSLIVAKTRALIRPKKNKEKVLKAEAILEYTTVKK